MSLSDERRFRTRRGDSRAESMNGLVFKRIIIANRGEIACRIFRTCRRLGIERVAVCSEAESFPLHAELADKDVLLPDSPNPVSGYLDIETMVGIALKSGTEAVYPGYGFLSENSRFAEACAESGIVFVGPPTGVIRLMGNKREARRKLAEYGVPVLPGTEVSLDGVDDLQTTAATVGFPLMVKASEGGGGIGMQLLAGPERLDRSKKRARSSSRRAFGSEDMYFKRFIPDARHVEVQVVADSDGVSPTCGSVSARCSGGTRR